MSGQGWSWLLAGVGVAGLYLVTRRDWRGYLVGLAVQVLWITYALVTWQLGFIASAIAYATVNVIGIRAFRRRHGQVREGEWKCGLCGRWLPTGAVCDGSQ